jgi:hypothetical protein
VFGYESEKMCAYRDLSGVEDLGVMVMKVVEETLRVEYGLIKGYEKEQVKVVENGNSE